LLGHSIVFLSQGGNGIVRIETLFRVDFSFPSSCLEDPFFMISFASCHKENIIVTLKMVVFLPRRSLGSMEGERRQSMVL
jgi:hypothetical protein